MIEIPSLRPETRYGMPPADHLLFNREYIVGYSYLFRQPRWAMEVIDPDNRAVKIPKRLDSFRPDLRIPDRFRAELDDYKGSGYDRGHLISSADRRASEIKNSETFLLTNMSPQLGALNQQIWRLHEDAVRNLSNLYVEVYVVCGPLFDVGQTIKQIGKGETKVPIPHSYFKSVLAEEVRGRMKLWSFIFPNKGSKKPFEKFLVTTREVEIRAGLPLWDRLRGTNADKMRSRKTKMWDLEKAKRAAEKREAKVAAAGEK